MKVEIIKAEDYGLETEKAEELTVGLKVVKAERELLVKEFEEVSKLELIQENLPKFKALRLKIVKNRTQGINKWHKTNKEFFLTGGKFVDAIKNKENAINEQMEEKLINAEKHFENLEKERIAKLQDERVFLLSEFVEDASERDLASMENDVWESYLATKKQSHLDKIQAELDAEKERQAKIKAEKEEQERIRKENAKLKAEAEERERLAKIESEKRAKAEAERKAKEDAERKIREEKERKERAEYETKLKAEREAKEKVEREERQKREKLEAELKSKKEAEQKAKDEEEFRIQAELNKGDNAKVKDLIADLELLKTKYSFKSAKNVKMYKDVGLLIDKVTNHINN
jgi:colicin import membrane protein